MQWDVIRDSHLETNVTDRPLYSIYICDRLYIKHPFTAKCNLCVQPKIAAISGQDRYSVIGMGVIYGVLAILCRNTKRIVSPRAMPLLPFTDKECGDVNKPCKQLQSIVKNA